jgi:hypothetical protein
LVIDKVFRCECRLNERGSRQPIGLHLTTTTTTTTHHHHHCHRHHCHHRFPLSLLDPCFPSAPGFRKENSREDQGHSAPESQELSPAKEGNAQRKEKSGPLLKSRM